MYTRIASVGVHFLAVVSPAPPTISVIETALNQQYIKSGSFSDRKNLGIAIRVYEPIMRIRTDGKYEYRTDAIESAKKALNETTNTVAVIGACEYARKMRRNLERAADHEDLTPELAALLSTTEIPVEVRRETSVGKSD